jgi:hypothetical protein
MNQRLLQEMYQQWCQGMNDYGRQWIDFVEIAAKIHNTTADQIMKELQKCSWFIKGE